MFQIGREGFNTGKEAFRIFGRERGCIKVRESITKVEDSQAGSSLRCQNNGLLCQDICEFLSGWF